MATLEISKNKGLYFVIPEECGTGVKKVAGKVAKDVEGTLSFCPEICENWQKHCAVRFQNLDR